MFRLEKKKIIAILIVILIIANNFLPIMVFADGNTAGDTSTESPEEVTTNYEIKENGEWDISKNKDGSIKAIWNFSERKLSITGQGSMMDFGPNDVYWEKYKKIIEKVEISDGITYLSDNLFSNCIRLTELNIPGSVEDIPTFFMSGCTKIETINIPAGVKTMYNAFRGCTNLKSISIPRTVTSINGSDFENCVSLESVNIDSNNSEYISIDGVVYSKDKKSIIYYPANKAGSTYKIDNNVTTITRYAFNYAQNLETIEFSTKTATIQDSAFSNSSLKFLTIPNTVTNMGDSIFKECTHLNTIVLPNTLKTIERWMFYNCRNLKSITIPNSVTSIGKCAFEGCSSIKELYIPSSVVNIDTYMVENYNGIIKCKTNSKAHQYAEENGRYYALTDNVTSNYSTNYKLQQTKNVNAFDGENNTIVATWNLSDKSLTISGSGEISNISYYYFPEKAFIEKVVIESGITSIGKYSFENYINLNNITLPNTVTNVGENAFSNCKNLVSIEIPNSVVTIGNSAFSGCSSLTNITIPNSVTTLGSDAFERCTALNSIEIPSNVNEIGTNSFSECNSLENISFANNSSYITQDGVLYNHNMTTLIRYAPKKSGETFVIPDSVTSINEYAFYGASNLKSITIPSKITSIGRYAFANCANLTDVQLNAKINELSYYIFYGCSSLKNIIIPDTVKIINGYAFNNCSSLEEIDLPDSLENLKGYYIFGNCANLEELNILYDEISILKGALTDYNGIINCKKNTTVHQHCEDNKKAYVLTDRDPSESDSDEQEQTEVIEIYTSDDMWDFAERFNNEEWSQVQQRNLKVELKNDIDLGCSEEKQWVPIGLTPKNSFISFNGIFEGNNYTISNMYISRRKYC